MIFYMARQGTCGRTDLDKCGLYLFIYLLVFLVTIINKGTHGVQEAICIWGVITQPSHKASENLTFILSLSFKCLCCYSCNMTSRGFHTKPWIWFILIKTYKIATFIRYLDSLAQFKLYAHV